MTARAARTKKKATPPTPPTLAALKLSAPKQVVTVHCIDGTTDAPLGVEIDVATQYSKHARAAQFRALEHFAEDHPNAKGLDQATVRELAGRYIVAHCVTRWNIEDCALTPKAALEVFDARGDIYVQVKSAYEESRSFFEPAKAS